MKYLRRRRLYNNTDFKEDHDPMSGMGNLFDIGLVFIVALMLALTGAMNMLDFFNENSEVTVVSKSGDGKMRIITKRGKKVEVQKVSDARISGEEGVRLGTAYKLKNGKTIYIPEKASRNGL